MPKFYASSKGFVGEILNTPDGTLEVHKFRVDFERKQLIKISYFCWNVKVKVEILTTASVEETVTGQVNPVALVKSRTKDSSTTCYVVCIDFKNEKFIPLQKFTINSKYIQLNEQDYRSQAERVFVLNGPCVAICYKSKIFIYYGSKAAVLEEFSFDIKCLCEGIARCCKHSTASVKYQSLLEIKKFNNKYLLFLVLQVKLQCKEHRSDVKSILRVLQFSGNQFTVLNTRHFIPDEYIECARSICVKSLEYDDSEMCRCELYLGTSEGYIIYIRNGNLVHCSTISEQSSVTCIKMIGIARNSNDDTGILVGADDAWTELTSELQIKKKYTAIRHILVGDFFQNGFSQFLLLKGDVGKGSGWVITDLKTRCLISDKDEPCAQKPTSKSSSTAVKALKARLQRDQILLHDEEVQLRRQADFISDMFAKQVSIAAGTPWKPQSCQPNMVNLIPGIEGEKQGLKTKPHPESEQAVGVKSHWQRTYEDSWCVGVDVVCYSDRSMKVWLDVVPDESYTRTVTMKSSCLTLSGSQTGSQSPGMCTGTSSIETQVASVVPAKRQKFSDRPPFKSFLRKDVGEFEALHDRERADVVEGEVVCVLPVPTFGVVDSVTASLILNWTHPDRKFGDYDFEKVVTPDKGQNEEGKGERRERIYTFCCGKVTLKARDVLDDKYELNFHVETGVDDQNMTDFKDLRINLQAWRHTQTIHPLVVKGSPGILARFESLLTDTCGFVYNQHYNCYVTMVTALRRVQMQLAPQDCDDNRELSVYTSCDKDLFLTIHHLYAHLPDHVVILPKENTSADIVNKCLPALQKEADFLSHGLRKLLSDHEAENASVDSDGDGDMRKVGEKFKRSRERMLKRKNDIMSNEKVKQFIEQYKRIQDLTDLAVTTAASAK